MPHASEGELSQAAENFRGYIAIVLRIYERTRQSRDSPERTDYDTLSLEHP
jgi:hypothetical protein